jgi:AcrR family transcriptional regulator
MAKSTGSESRQSATPETLDPAQAKAQSRANSFMKSALTILGETGRTDFTVLEVVERSKTSLRAFYQHFATKDELLLALIERIMAGATQQWRAETAGLPSDKALRTLIDRISAPAESTKQDSINRGLTFYNDHLIESRPTEFARVLQPLHELIGDILRQGITEGTIRHDVDVQTSSAILMQVILGALRLRNLGSELNGTPVASSDIYEFVVRGLTAD